MLIPAKTELSDVKRHAGQLCFLEGTVVYNQLGEAKCCILSDGVFLSIHYTMIFERCI